MPAHNVFTEIDARSYAAIVKKGYLSEVLLALLVDPLEAEDVAESIDTRRFSSILLQANGLVVSAPIRLEDFQGLPSKDAFEKLKITLYQRVMKSGRAESALSQITEWSQRIGVWCACAVAREALRYVPEGDQRPLRAIEMAELWAVGKATINEVKAASYDAYNTYVSAPRRLAGFAAAAYAASSAARSVTSTTDGAISAAASNTVHDSARAAADYARASAAGVDWNNTFNAELIRLREVVANACLTFPG